MYKDISQFIDVNRVLEEIIIKDDLRVLDFGCGVGAISIPCAKMLPKGTVFAVDKNADVLNVMLNRAKSENINNLIVLNSSFEDLEFQQEYFDLVIMSSVYHELEDAPLILKKINNWLKSTGILSVIEWKKERKEDFGPPAVVRVKEDLLLGTLIFSGFDLIHMEDLTPSIYHVILKKSDRISS
ncbi:MAG TPA: class I SAM-dependent methyltransferase [Thermodesulfobium narugense]|uniref:Methyltransferase domain-containing protein n=1 Tax=Thermodesulfobium acidiphilum TaxID=1794699 RepID=A0A2R4W326_THEAF|nr:Methyltransferase domain-containing protein [Thermodesulfobium acidiphilum]HEM55891.1 class I SAM-dependent methyltransferase [Thermodesulfobium narugense]